MVLSPRHRRQRVHQIPLGLICPNPRQPRRVFSSESLAELSRSIQQHGILQPLTVREVAGTGRYELIAGERRLRAAALAGLSDAPCLVLPADDALSAELALIENLQREDLHFLEEAEGIAALIAASSLSQEQAALRLGLSQPSVANKLRLLRLPPELRERILHSSLTERHARALLRLPAPELQQRVLEAVLAQKLNVSQTEALIEELLRARPRPIRKFVVRDVRIFVNTLNKAVSTMRASGIDAQSQKTETDEYIQYVVRIPKPQ